jgi:prophage regulatory protein
MSENGGPKARARYLRQRDVLQLVGVSRPTLWEWRRKGIFPRPRQLGPNTIGWLADDVEKWMQSRPSAG